MRTITIIQARTTSTRLPKKSLLSILGYPSAVLAALRAANLGAEVVIATSTDSSDDVLAKECRKYGVHVFRGPLDDVLARYYLATAHLYDECIVIRLTADNVLPDGAFIHELESAFAASGLEYLRADSLQGPLPYGLGAEAFTVAALRKAHAAASSPTDREHVGPWMARNCKAGFYIPQSLAGADYSHLRCTIDDEEDYQRILRLVCGVADPLRIGWQELVQKLVLLPGEPSFRVPYRVVRDRIHSEFTLGTVQLGMKYGIVNQIGQPLKSVAIGIVRRAISHGVRTLDTARTYGSAEQVLREALSGSWRSRVEVITKLDLPPSFAADTDASTVRAAVDESVNQSCLALGIPRLQTLLLHCWQHYRLWKGTVWRRLLDLREREKIGILGTSVYEPAEALDALSDADIQHLQIPMNILDWRWKAAGVDQAIASRPDVVVHARSALLQGILVHPAERWPVIDGFDAASCVRQLHTMARQFDRESVGDLCLAYVRSQPWITSVVVGCETMAQLEENLRFFRLPKLAPEQSEELERALPDAPDTLLNPSKWNRRSKRDFAHEPSAIHQR